MALNTSDPEAVRQAAKDILSQSQFTSQHPSTWDRIFFYATHPLDLLSLIFNWGLSRFLGAADNVIIGSIIAIVIGAAIVIAVVRFGRSTSRNSAVRVHYAPAETGKSFKELIAEAEAFERDEQWRDAIRIRYAALILKLSEQGVVRARSGRTTGEYLREVGTNAPAVVDVFGRATRLFEWVWYGEGQPGRDDAVEFKMLALDATQKVAA